jgi:hypothetical protein
VPNKAQLFLALAKHHEAVFTVNFSAVLASELRMHLVALESCLQKEGTPISQKGEEIIKGAFS